MRVIVKGAFARDLVAALARVAHRLRQELVVQGPAAAAVVLWAKTERGCILGASSLSEKQVRKRKGAESRRGGKGRGR
eukprot:756115-Hanusia_phi.AAC.2